MIVTAPNEFVAEVHDRMPVLLTEREAENMRDRGVNIGKHRRALCELFRQRKQGTALAVEDRIRWYFLSVAFEEIRLFDIERACR